MSKELLKQVLHSVINEDHQQAEQHLHDYLVSKMKMLGEEETNQSSIEQVASTLKFLPTRKQRLKYQFFSGATDSMPAMSYKLSDSDSELVKTITSSDTEDHPETKNVALKGDVIMSGPSKEKYVVKAAKFGKLYDGNVGGEVYPEQSPRQVAHYTGHDPITFTASWGEEMKLVPGDYLVKEAEGKYYRIAKHEFEQTYNNPGH